MRRKKQLTLLPPDFPKEICWGEGTTDANEFPKVIWFFWHTKELPFSVQTSLDTIRKSFVGYEINVLNFDNLDKYNLDINFLKEKIKVQAISDYIRLYLVSNYGGIWIDATTYFTVPIYDLFDIDNKSDFYGFYTDMCTTDMNFPVVESYFLAAPKNSPFMRDWFKEFEKCVFSENPYTYYQEYYEDKTFIQNLINPSYLIVYVSCMIIMRKSKQYNLRLYTAGETSHFYTYSFFYGKMNVYETFFINKIPKKLPGIIKITGERRTEIDTYIKTGLYKNKSLIFSLNNSENNSLFKRFFKILKFIMYH